MLKFYFNGSPNPTKVALFLEESGLPFEPIAVDTRKGDQFKPEYLKVNPNAKVPAIDDDGVLVFDSNAILLYLAEKTGKFLPSNTPQNRAQMLSWLMFVATGVGPYSGQAVHFKHFAPKDHNHDYSHNRYQFEAQRHYTVLNDHLAGKKYMAVRMPPCTKPAGLQNSRFPSKPILIQPSPGRASSRCQPSSVALGGAAMRSSAVAIMGTSVSLPDTAGLLTA